MQQNIVQQPDGYLNKTPLFQFIFSPACSRCGAARPA